MSDQAWTFTDNYIPKWSFRPLMSTLRFPSLIRWMFLIFHWIPGSSFLSFWIPKSSRDVIRRASLCYTMLDEDFSFFKGPVKLKIWKHWQPSWNVELESLQQEYQFELERKYNHNGSELVTLKMRNQMYNEALATVSCTVIVKTNGWNVEKRNISLGSSLGTSIWVPIVV